VLPDCGRLYFYEPLAFFWAIEQQNIPLIEQTLEAAFQVGLMQGAIPDLAITFQIGSQRFETSENMTIRRLGAKLAVRLTMFVPPMDATVAHLTRILELVEVVNDPYEMAFTLLAFGKTAAIQQNFPDAISFLERSLTLSRSLDSNNLIMQTLTLLGNAYYSIGDAENARKLGQESTILCRVLDNKHYLMQSLQTTAAALNLIDQFDQGEQLYQEVHNLQKSNNDRRGAAFTLARLATIKMLQLEFEETYRLASEALIIGRELNDFIVRGRAIVVLSYYYVSQEKYDVTLQLHEEYQKIPLISPDFVPHYLDAIMSAFGYFGTQNYEQAHTQTVVALKFLRRIRFRVVVSAVLTSFAFLRAQAGRTEDAVILMGCTIQCGLSAAWIQKWPMFTRMRNELKVTLGETAFDGLWHQGMVVSIDETVERLLKEEMILK